MDKVHFLKNLHWKECCELPVNMYNAQCVSLHGKIYVGGGATSSQDPYKLFVSTDLMSWSAFKTPSKFYALTTYHSHLVLIGGVERDDKYSTSTDKVWVTGAEQIEWQLSLPPMKTSRHSSSAINIQTMQSQNECIIVIGGVEEPVNSEEILLNTVEVFVQGEWSIMQPLPLQCSSIKCTICDEVLYLMGGYKQGNFVFYCKLDSFLSSLRSTDTLWKTSQVPLCYSSCVTFLHHLVSVGGFFHSSSSFSSSKIHAYSPLSQSWLHVGDLPIEVSLTASTIISTGELVVIGGVNLEMNSYKVFKASLEGSQYLAAYDRILAKRVSLDMLFLNMLFVGPPRLGKTTARRRLTGEIVDIDSAGESEQISTGTVEKGHSIVIRNISHTTAVVTPSEWSVLKDHTDEARMFLQFFDRANNQEVTVTPPFRPPAQHSSGKYHSIASRFLKSIKRNVVHFFRKHFGIRRRSKVKVTKQEKDQGVTHSEERSLNLEMTDNEIFEFFQEAVTTNWEEVKFLLENTALLNMSDTGGQPEFMDMLPALVIGPALYLLFCKLTQELQSSYTVSYLSPSGESTTPVESTYTVVEVMFQALSAIACLANSESERKEEGNQLFPDLMASPQSKAFIVATHKDLVSEEHITKFDAELQERIRATDFYREGLVQFSSENRLILAIDNKSGGGEEVDTLRKFFEKHMQKHYRKIKIPAAWFVLSLYLRKQEKRAVSIENCLDWAQKLNMSTEETEAALWFLHHRAGTLMYFPNLTELQDTIISDVQIVYDSVSNLIINTFRFGKVEKAASEKFRETGQFSLDDIRGATADISGDYIPLVQLVKLLEHLNIIAIIKQPEPDPSQDSHAKSSKVVYFMPCVLKNAPNEELLIFQENDSNSVLPASLMIRYECGFVPLGLFPATIANLVGNGSLKLIVEGIKKNRVQFRYSTDRDTITLISRPHFYEVHITREATAKTEAHEVCGAVREIIESSLKTVTSRMNYAFTVSYQLAFECPSHPGRDHLCVVDSKETSPHMMDCLHNLKNPQPVEMQNQHLVWFGKPMTDIRDEIRRLDPTFQSVNSNSLWDEDTKMDYLQLIKYFDPETGEHREIRVLDDLAPYWRKIAELVGIPPYHIKSIAKQESDVDCLRDMVGEWLANAPLMPHCKRYSEKWRGLHNLLKDGRQEKLAADLEAALNAEKCSIRGNCDEDSEVLHPSTSLSNHASLPTAPAMHTSQSEVSCPPPTMMDILCFPLQDSKVNLAREIGTKYFEFGTLLLEDETGAHISALELQLQTNAQSINRHIFQEWFSGGGRQPVSWETLISVLEDIGLDQLAKSIKNAKL